MQSNLLGMLNREQEHKGHRLRPPCQRPPHGDQRSPTRDLIGNGFKSMTRRRQLSALQEYASIRAGWGKGLAADLISKHLRGYPRFIVDCGGDIRIGGPDAHTVPYEVLVQHPQTGQLPYVLRLRSGAVATSAINVRIWQASEGHYAHHLLDPSTGAPAWTGLTSATAIGHTTLEAETLAKVALLSGPDGGRVVLARLGGLLVHDSGRIEAAGPLRANPGIRFPTP